MKHTETVIPFNRKKEIIIAKPVSVIKTFITGLLLSLVRKQGEIDYGDVCQIVVRQENVVTAPEDLALYREVCGFQSDGFLPVSYPEVLFLDSMGIMITNSDFPLSTLGLIHVQQKITLHRGIPETALLDLRCSMGRMVRTHKGIRLEILLHASIDAETAWEGTTVLLSRYRETIRKTGVKRKGPGGARDMKNKEVFAVAKDTGLKYARATGDYNPHHLYPFTARLLGYRRPIAHGMWSLARSISAIEEKGALKPPFSVEAFFKLPLYMPSDVTLNFDIDESDTGIEFNLVNSRNNLPHLAGTINY